MDRGRKLQLLDSLVTSLCVERGSMPVETDDIDELWDTFRALVNTREPWPADEEMLAEQDELLAGIIAEHGIHGIEETAPQGDPRLRLWRGDITTIATDAIVNAANSQMLGCWVPGHYCIDNAIHTFAGVQLRIECARIMKAQGHEEPTGHAKITGAYNLPSRHVLHTVGPIVDGVPTELERAQLASCYTSCLELATAEGLGSVAFCCISTGVFGFPKQDAAEVAVGTVRRWMDDSDSDIVVVFNVFGDGDESIYRGLL